MRLRREWLLTAILALGCAMDPPAPPATVSRLDASSAAGVSSPVTGASSAAPISTARVRELSRALEKIRGRKFKREVTVNFVTLAQLRPRLVALFDAEMPLERLRHEGDYLRALRLLPADADLRKLYLALYRSQVVGLYDPVSRSLFVVTDYHAPGGETAMPGISGLNLTDIAIVHELDHALSDQYFSLDERFKKVRGRRDAEAALQALVEGEATLAMVQYALREVVGGGDDPESEGELLATVAQQLDPASLMGLTANDPAMRGIPPFLIQHLAASYADGLQYTLRAWRKGGWAAVDALYQNPPDSTREVLGGANIAGAVNPAAVLRDPDCAPGAAALREAPGAQDLRLWAFVQSGESPAAGPPVAEDSRLAICTVPGGTTELRWVIAWNSTRPPDALRRTARKAWPASRVDWQPGGLVQITALL